MSSTPFAWARTHWNRKAAVSSAAAVAAVLAMGSGAVQAACWHEAAERYNINPYLLQAIAKCESSMNPNAMNRSHIERTGTYDIGLMQINSSNLRALKAHGIGETELMDACTNLNVGAWILSQKIRRYGNNWEAVGAYNAACSQLKGEACTAARDKYARCVHRHLPAELKGGQGQPVVADEQREKAQVADAKSPRSSRKKPTSNQAVQAVSQLVAVKVTP